MGHRNTEQIVVLLTDSEGTGDAPTPWTESGEDHMLGQRVIADLGHGSVGLWSKSCLLVRTGQTCPSQSGSFGRWRFFVLC